MGLTIYYTFKKILKVIVATMLLFVLSVQSIATSASTQQIYVLASNHTLLDSEICANKHQTESQILQAAIVSNAKEYDIPQWVLYGIAYNETHFDPTDTTQVYLPSQTSSKDAQGAMQIILPMAAFVATEKERKGLTAKKLRTDTKLNCELASRFIKYLYDKYNLSWDKALCAYATGSPNKGRFYYRLTKKHGKRIASKMK